MHFEQKLLSCTIFLPDNKLPCVLCCWTQPGWSRAGNDTLEIWPTRHEQLVHKSNISIFQLPHFQFSNCQCCCWNMKLSVKTFPSLLTISQADKSSAISSVYSESQKHFLTTFPQLRYWVILTHTQRHTHKNTHKHTISKSQEFVTFSDSRAPVLSLSSRFGISKIFLCLLVYFLISKTLFVEHRLMLFWYFVACEGIGKLPWALKAENTHPCFVCVTICVLAPATASDVI